MILYLLFVVFLLFVILFFLDKKHVSEEFVSYTKCKKYKNNKLMSEFLKKSNIDRVDIKSDWDLYLPCGYTNVENDLDSLIPKNKNQKIFGIKGCDRLAAKDHLWNNFLKRYGRKVAKQYMPDTYVLNDLNQMAEFKKNYRLKNTYLLKKNIQRKQGIKITKDLATIVRGRDDGFVVVQRYLDNLYLINKRKINLRMYLLITCKNGNVGWYLSKLGKCIYTNKDFNKDDINDPEKHLTSLNLDKNIYHSNPLTLSDLKRHLGNENYNKLFYRILVIMKKCKNSYKGKLCSESRFNDNMMFQLFGLDFVFDDKFNPYLLEMNKGPQMKFMNKVEKHMKMKIIRDIFAKVNVINVKNNSFIKI